MQRKIKQNKKEYLKRLDKTVEEIKKLPLHKIDEEVRFLKKAFDIAYKNDIFSLYKFDKNTQEKLKLKLFSILTPYSGNLSFLAIQILAANSIMAKNDFKRRKYFFNKKCGIAINHLRSNKTHVRAKKYKNGYLLNGVLTWASGYKIFDKLLIGFHFENKEYEVLASFEKSKSFKILETPKTFVGQGLNTINVYLENFFVKDINIVSANSIGNYTKNKSLSKTVHYALYGIALGAIDKLDSHTLKNSSKIKLKDIKKRFLNSTNGQELDNLRVELFDLTQNIITTGMVLNGGKSILHNSHLQRYYKEIIMFNSNGLNAPIKNLFLNKFTQV
ncbi:MAG: hypothetical protein ACNI28_10570 [Arcobacter sp.]|uniref:hypothetical protein n=1 Tax=Arcobacter sp. TaxID=1872629 RepID=UPI003AFF7264